MLRSLARLTGYKIYAADGESGSVYDFYFDEPTWTIQYVAVDTSPWIMGRHVLLYKDLLNNIDWDAEKFIVHLTKQEVYNSPDLAMIQPIARQQQIHLDWYYGSPDWQTEARESGAYPEEPRGSHLRSVRELHYYTLHARNGASGQVRDCLANDAAWLIRYLVIDTGGRVPGKQILMATEWITAVSQNDHTIGVDFTKDSITESPAYDAATTVDRGYEQQLYDYYGIIPD